MTRVCPQCGNATAQPVCPVDGWSTVPEALLADRGLSLGELLIDRFRVGAFLRLDGAVSIYGGLDERTARPVHINVVPIPAGTPLEIVGRMQRAARTLEGVRHPMLVSVLASGTTARGDLAIVAERVSGPTLADKLKAGPLASKATLEMGHALFAGLEAAHAAGVAHHDLTPDRIVMRADDRIVVDRLGLFDLLRMTRPQGDEIALTPQSVTYGAPELARDKLVTRQADIYSVGAILYESLTGRPVFDEASAADRLVAHLSRDPAPPVVDGVRLEGPLVELILHCLAKKPWNRPQGAAVARAAFEGAAHGPAAWPAVVEVSAAESTPKPAPLPEVPVPTPLVTRDVGRPRVEARTRPHLSGVVALAPQKKAKRAWWPLVALAALLALCAWPIVASFDHQSVATVEHEAPRAALNDAASDAKAAKAAADAKAAAEAKAAEERAAAEAKVAAAKAAEERAAAEAKAAEAKAAEERAAAEAKAAEAKVAEEIAAAERAAAESRAAEAKAAAEKLQPPKVVAPVAPVVASKHAGTWRERQAQIEAEARAEAERRAEANARWKAKVEAQRQADAAKTDAPKGPDTSTDRNDTPPAAAFRRVAVLSSPAGAAVVIDGRAVGYTPAVITFAPGAKGRAIVMLAGHDTTSFEFDDRINGRTLKFDLTPSK